MYFFAFGHEEQLEQELKRKRGGKKENIYKSANYCRFQNS
jgi:hypothetical protein